MPLVLVTITTRASFHPCASNDKGTDQQKLVGKLGWALPFYFMERKRVFKLSPETPASYIVVNHLKLHGQAVNAPDIRIHCEFGKRASKRQVDNANQQLMRFVSLWFMKSLYGEFVDLPMPRILITSNWGSSHGTSTWKEEISSKLVVKHRAPTW